MLVEPNNVSLWAQRMQWLAEHPADAERMGQHARDAAETKTMEKHLEDLQYVYEMAINSKKS